MTIPLKPNPHSFQNRIYILMALTSLGFLGVLAGYWRVQISHGKHYERLGEKYRIKTKPIKAVRGFIYDRHGTLLTQNRPTYNLVLQRDEMEEPWPKLRQKLSAFLGITEKTLQNRYKKRSGLLSQPVVLRENINFKESLRIRRNQLRYPGLSIEIEEKRYYTSGSLFTHVLGYVAQASKRDLERNKQVKLGQIIGKSGVERAYDDLLTGEDGEKEIHIDHRGVYRSQDIKTAPVPGQDLHLTLDYDLQQLAVDALQNRGGSIVMMNVRTGELLVYISSPSYDLNSFTDVDEWQRLNQSPSKPFLNRPVQGAYAPGSVFKLVTALASLKHNKATPETKYFCSGEFVLHDHVSECHNRDGHGWMDMKQAIQFSCNVYFYNIAKDLDIDDLAQMARSLGFGRKSGIDLVGEKAGLMPDRSWKRERYNEIWYPGETLSVVIGQGALLATPLQLAQLMATIATDGEAPTPHFLLKSGKNQHFSNYQNKNKRVDIPKEHFAILKDAMWMVVNRNRGTGSNARIEGFDVCGKTGTAQLITFRTEDDNKNADYLNAWFAGFAPRQDPEVAIIVLVEQAGAGSHQAAPIVKKLLEAYRAGVNRVNPI